ncbi:hypothetical protein ROHU_023093 [Labeo rohita]|uniref:Uncharacterized protein n=1 Tax=Labeo rohita TaxID=84645 RepID=A0A498MP57_LABRO|nr:hypothetical protein ROHU_023093 [Labeo rohita]
MGKPSRGEDFLQICIPTRALKDPQSLQHNETRRCSRCSEQADYLERSVSFRQTSDFITRRRFGVYEMNC